MKFKNVKISQILDSPPTNSGLQKKDVVFINASKNLLPVYSASKDENAIFGWLPNNSKWKKYKNVLTWNKDGSSGVVFYRKNEFIPYEKVKILQIKPEYSKQLNYQYLRKIIEINLLAKGFDFTFKCSMERVMEISISIPVKEDGKYDFEEQQNLTEKYNAIDELEEDIKNTKKTLNDTEVDCNIKVKTKEFHINYVLDIFRGNPKYTNKFIIENIGIYPVYSSQTKDIGMIGRINTFDFDVECLTYTTNGVYAGTVFYRPKHKFSLNADAALLLIKEEYKDKLDYKYLYFILSKELKRHSFGWENKPHPSRIKKIFIPIPVNSEGNFDIDKQRILSELYGKILAIKEEIVTEFDNLSSYKLKIA